MTVTTSRAVRADNFFGIEQSRISRVEKKMKPNPAYEAETAKIKAHKDQYTGVHKFKAATWTHPNGHPRCYLCGQEESISPECNREPTQAESDALTAKWVAEFSSRGDRVSKAGKVIRVARGIGRRIGGFDPNEPRDARGRWTLGGNNDTVINAAHLAAHKEETSRLKRVAAAAKLNSTPAGKRRGGTPNLTGAKNSSVSVSIAPTQRLTRAASPVERKNTKSFIENGAPHKVTGASQITSNSDHLYATQVLTRGQGRAGQPGKGMDAGYRNKVATANIQNMPEHAGLTDAELKLKVQEETGRLAKLEKSIHEVMLPSGGNRTELEQIQTSGNVGTDMTYQQGRALNAFAKGQLSHRLVPREGQLPDIVVKATSGEIQRRSIAGKYIGISSNGFKYTIPAVEAHKLIAAGKKHWDKQTISDANYKVQVRAEKKREQSAPGFIDAAASAAAWKAELAYKRDSAVRELRDAGIDENDTTNQVIITGWKELLAVQDKDWVYSTVGAPIALKYKQLSTDLKAHSKDEAIAHAFANSRNEAEVVAEFAAVRKEIRDKQLKMKNQHPELRRTIQRGFLASDPPPLSDQTRAMVERILSVADAQIAAADQTLTLPPDFPTWSKADQKTYKIKAAIDLSASKKRAAEAQKVKSFWNPKTGTMTSRGIRTSGVRTKSIARVKSVFTSQEGVPLDTKLKPPSKYTPRKPHKIVIQPRMRKATKTELEEFFPEKPAKDAVTAAPAGNGRKTERKARDAQPSISAGTLPDRWTNIQVPVNYPGTNTAGIKFTYDYVQVKSKKATHERVYTQEHHWQSSEAKYDDITAITPHMALLDKKLAAESKTNDNAAVVAIMRILAMRPSSPNAGTTEMKRDANGDPILGKDGKPTYGAATPTFGATTLTHDMVTFDGNTTVFAFTGKAAHAYSIRTDDPTIRAIFKARLSSKKSDAKKQIFPGADEKTANDYIQSVFPPNSAKDMRTYIANEIAKQVIAGMPRPTSLAEFKNAIATVSEHTANQLNHLPPQSIKSYIDPMQFLAWANNIVPPFDWEAFFHPPKGNTRVTRLKKSWEVANAIHRNSRRERRSRVSTRIDVRKSASTSRTRRHSQWQEYSLL